MKPKFSMTARAVIMAVASLLTWTPTQASAQTNEPSIYGVGEYNTLRLEPGFALPLNSPQTDHYKGGAAISAKLDLHITPWIDVFPSVTFIGLSMGDKFTAGNQVGTSWAYGLGLRVGRPHDYTNNTGSGWSAFSPWIDGEPIYVRTAGLNRFGIQAATGVYFPTSESRWLWTGPFIGFQEITDGTSVGGTVGKDTTDARVGIIGWGFEFGARHSKQMTPVTPEVKKDVTEVVMTIDPTPVEEPPPATTVVNYHKKAPFRVQFDFDSAKLTAEYQATLDQMAEEISLQLKSNPSFHVEIDGHASDEGHPWAAEHNQKLSELRAAAVHDYLVSKGAPPAGLSVKGFGTSQPIESNATEAGREANRRVEFDVTITLTCKGGKDCQ